jgi:hypothetical protein
MVVTVKAHQWEPPDRPKLLVSARRVGEELDVPIWKANEICWCLDRRFYAPGQVHYRVTRASLDAFKGLLADGMTVQAARAVMWHFKQRGSLPPADLGQEERDWIYWQSRQRRRHRDSAELAGQAR